MAAYDRPELGARKFEPGPFYSSRELPRRDRI
jgi:hypothetical protein